MTELLDWLLFIVAFLVALGLFVGAGSLFVRWAAWTWRQVSFFQIDVQARRIDLERQAIDVDLVRADSFGLLPVPRAALMTQGGAAAALATHQEYQRSRAAVPASLTYSPHHSVRYDNDVQSTGLALPEVSSAPFVVPSFAQMLQTDMLRPGQLMVGFDDESRQPLYRTFADLYSSAVGGLSGSGKSTLTRLLLAQAALGGCKFLICDPHLGAGGDSLGESLTPLRGRMIADVAADDKSILDAVRLINLLGKRRLKGDSDRSPLLLVIDEATMLLNRSTIAGPLADILRAISQEYRKVNIYALLLGQIWTASATGGDSSLRDSLASAFVFRMKRQQARLLVSTEIAKEVESLPQFQALFSAASGEVHRLHVPNTTTHDIELVAQRLSVGGSKPKKVFALPTPVDSGSRAGSVGGSRAGSNVDLDDDAEPLAEPGSEPPMEPLRIDPIVDSARVARVRAMLADKESLNEIIRVVWNIQGKGRAWQAARAELHEIIALIARGAV